MTTAHATHAPIRTDDAHDMETATLRVMADRLDMLAEQLDSIDEQAPMHADLLREHADQLVELAACSVREESHVDAELDRAAQLASEWAHHVARSYARRLLGPRLYGQVADASVLLGELALVLYEEQLAARGELPVVDDVASFDCTGMRRQLRVIATGYAWARRRCGAPSRYRQVLLDSLADTLERTDMLAPRIEERLAPPASCATRVALERFYDEWLADAPASLHRDIDAACADACRTQRNGAAGRSPSGADAELWFDLGVACAVAWRIFETGAAQGTARVPVTGSVWEWLAALTLVGRDDEHANVQIQAQP